MKGSGSEREGLILRQGEEGDLDKVQVEEGETRPRRIEPNRVVAA